MRTVDLDTLKPEGYEVHFQGSKYLLAAMTVEQIMEAIPAIQAFRMLAAGAGADNLDRLGELMAKAGEFITKAIPDFPVELLRQMTVPQLNKFVELVAEMVSAKPPADGEDGAPKPEAEKT